MNIEEWLPAMHYSCCEYPGNDTGILSFFSPANKINDVKLGIKGHPQGVRRGWFMWPVNFDPTWLIECNGFSKLKIKGVNLNE